MTIVARFLTLAAATALSVGALSALATAVIAGDAKVHDFVLAITGTDGLTFIGSCKLKTADGFVDMPLDGVVPEHREVRGTGLKCVIEKSGREGTLTVEVMRDGRVVSYNSNSGSSSIVNVSVR
jgi:hypothetical protein